MSAVKQLDAGEVSLAKIFCSDYDFKIPDYQRPYSWKREQTLQLLDDLDDALDREQDEPYFLGSIVLVKSKGSPEADVIDGQQRLTTLTILFSVLRHLAEDQELANELNAVILEPGSRLAGTQAKPRLRLRPRDADFFERWIQRPGRLNELIALPDSEATTDARRAIRDNTKALLERLETWDDARRERLAAMMGSRTFLVVVSTPDLASAHRIFSVMNARGLDLTAADIFKATVIGSLPDSDQSEYADKWETEEEDLGRDNFADLFQHIRMITAKVKARRELLKEFDEQVLSAYLPGRAAHFVDDVLLPYSDSYEDLLYWKYGRSETVNAFLRRLSMIDNADWRPPALWALRHHSKDPDFLEEFLRKLERLAVWMLVTRAYVTPRVARYGELLKELDKGMGLDATSFELSEDEARATRDGLAGEIYTSAPVRRYVLLRLDELLANEPGVSYEHRLITVEHVLPQHPRLDSEWSRTFTEDERRHWVHRLANLVLLNRAKNAQAQNYDFDVKKTSYFGGRNGVATFALTSQVVHTPEWTPETLKHRQRDLLSLLEAEWRLEQ